MKIRDRIAAAWRALVPKGAGKRDPYAGTYGTGSTAGFAGGAVGRLTASLATWSGSVNADLDGSLPILRARARALAANNEHGRRFLTLVSTNVVGRGNPKLQVRAAERTGKLDKVANDTIEVHWDRWGATADITGRHRSHYSLWRTVIKAVARDGEALVRKVRDRRLPYGMGLQLLEADRLDEARNQRLENGNTIRQGVEVDSTLRAVAYWVKTAHPGENYATSAMNIERVPAGEMVHLFLPERAEQVRGVTWFHAVIVRASIIHDFEESAVVAAKLGASKVATLVSHPDSPVAENVGEGMGDAKVGGIPQISAEAGEILDFTQYPGVQMQSWDPEYPHANFESFLKACLRGLAAGCDVAAHNLTGDMTDVNYSSARIAELAEREVWMTLQDWFIESFVLPIYEEWLAMALLTGAITFDGSGKALPADKLQKFLTASRFQGRRWSWVDPSKEASANETLLANGLTSRTRIAAEQGEEFDDILDELAQEQTQMEAAGLPTSPKAAPPAVPPAPTSDPAGKDLAEAIGRALAREPAAPVVPQVTVHPPTVTIHQGDVHVAPAAVEVRAEASPPVVTIQPAAVEVRVDAILPEQPAAVVEVNVEMPDHMRMDIASMPVRKTTSAIERNMAGEIVKSTQLETDA